MEIIKLFLPDINIKSLIIVGILAFSGCCILGFMVSYFAK